MENNIKHEIKRENNSSPVDITMDDIAGSDDDIPEDDYDYKFNLESIGKISSDMQESTAERQIGWLAKVKDEPSDEGEYEYGHLNNNHCDIREANVKIKTEIEEIKQETIGDFDDLIDENSNAIHNVWTKLQDTDLAQHCKRENEELSDGSDYFIENCIDVKNDTKDYLNEVDSTFFDNQRGYAFVKDDIEFEDHCVKSEYENTYSRIKRDCSNDVTNRPIFECHLCDYKTTAKRKLKRHGTLHEDPSKLLWFYCTKCSYKTRQRGHLKRHDLIHQNHEEIELFTCAICNYKSKQKCTLRRHIKDVHSHHKRNEDAQESQSYQHEKFMCSLCSYSTFKKGLLLSHLDKHKDTQDVKSLYICDICSFSTKYRRNLRVHFDTHRDAQVLQIYECNPCRFKTRMGYCLKRHFLSKKHLQMVGKLAEYCPRSMKLKQEKDS